jgi:hypothetical protein
MKKLFARILIVLLVLLIAAIAVMQSGAAEVILREGSSAHGNPASAQMSGPAQATANSAAEQFYLQLTTIATPGK